MCLHNKLHRHALHPRPSSYQRMNAPSVFMLPRPHSQPKQEFNEGRWTKVEHEAFVKGLELYGKEWKKIATLVPTRSIVQIRTHAQKFFLKIAKTKFENKGKQVPADLKSTAIKSSYNLETLQDALSDVHEPRKLRRKSTLASVDFDQVHRYNEVEEEQFGLKSAPILDGFSFQDNQFADNKRQRSLFATGSGLYSTIDYLPQDEGVDLFNSSPLFNELGTIDEEMTNDTETFGSTSVSNSNASAVRAQEQEEIDPLLDLINGELEPIPVPFGTE